MNSSKGQLDEMDDDNDDLNEKQDGLTQKHLDDIIERLINFEKYPGYTISENKNSGSGNDNLPFILKEKEIRQIISTAEDVFKE